MAASKPPPQVCEICHEREATAAAVLSLKNTGSNIRLTNLCQACLDAHIAKSPPSLQEMLDQLESESDDGSKA